MIQRPQSLVIIIAILGLILTNAFTLSSYTPEIKDIDLDTQKKGEFGFAVNTNGVAFFALPNAELSDAAQEMVDNSVEEMNTRVAELSDDRGLSKLFIFGIAGLLIIILLAIYMLISFKNRKRQIALGWTSMILSLIAFLALFGVAQMGPEVLDRLLSQFLPYNLSEEIIWNTHYGVGIFMPLAASIAFFVAIRMIKKDQDLIASVDRIR